MCQRMRRSLSFSSTPYSASDGGKNFAAGLVASLLIRTGLFLDQIIELGEINRVPTRDAISWFSGCLCCQTRVYLAAGFGDHLIVSVVPSSACLDSHN